MLSSSVTNRIRAFITGHNYKYVQTIALFVDIYLGIDNYVWDFEKVQFRSSHFHKSIIIIFAKCQNTTVYANPRGLFCVIKNVYPCSHDEILYFEA